MTIYEMKAINSAGEDISLAKYKGSVLLIANTASKCGLTPQYGELQKLYDEYKDKGLEILGFPCNQFGAQEPGTSEEAASFCQINYGVTFPVFAKVDVNGETAHPLFRYLKNEQPGEATEGEIAWNFTKFLVDRDGKVVQRFEPKETPEMMKESIESLLG